MDGHPVAFGLAPLKYVKTARSRLRNFTEESNPGAVAAFQVADNIGIRCAPVFLSAQGSINKRGSLTSPPA